MQFLGTFVSLFDRSTGRWKWYAIFLLRTTPKNSFQSHPRNRGWVSNLLNSGPIEPLKGIGELDNVMMIILFSFLAYLEERYRGVTGLPLKFPYFMGKEHGFRSTIESFWLHLSTIEDLTKLKSHQKDREFLKIWLNNSKSSTSLGKPMRKAMESHGAGAAFRCRVSHGAGTASPVNSQPKVRCPMMLGGPRDRWGRIFSGFSHGFSHGFLMKSIVFWKKNHETHETNWYIEENWASTFEPSTVEWFASKHEMGFTGI